ncbi:MAG: pectinacetylesterase family protein, partial [Gammaproteobacteria bacterium]|nr:pectinacetylesterase family protein [Gammaproteobacteria bacterium]
MNKIGLFRNITLLCALVLISINLSAHDDDDYDYGTPPNSLPEWEKIQLPAVDWVRDPNNPDLTRTIHPGCAFTYQTGDPYQFYYKAGDKEKLLIYFNGGGACWNDHTCITSLKIGDRPTYNPSLAEENDPVIAAGILDTNNSKNPFKDWSMIFLPYCTGDIHIGSKDSVYSDLTGVVTGVPGAPVAVQHKGFDNVLGVKKWIRKNLKNRRGTSSMDKILLAGSSAGGYGAVFNFAHIKNTFRKAEVNLISDSS